MPESRFNPASFGKPLPRCPIAGHDHETRWLGAVFQHLSENRADFVECPTGRWRWMIVDGVDYAALQTRGKIGYRMARPRWGWPRINGLKNANLEQPS